ncbi:unnamed protein product [Linum tenue]|uniref:Uncharacterized protein n=2 Tax=Linum tenue TaxID=586396 RepID=A0AAV0S9V2_9ROSI|nr:unnamed protein product [Linum tenue]
MKQAGKSHKVAQNGSGSKATADARKDRKSATGMNGSPKKGGHGGKFTWIGGDGFYSSEEMWRRGGEAVDLKDPNFEEPEMVAEEEKGEGGVQAA